MRTYAFALAVGLCAFPASAFAQAIEIGPRGVEVEPYPEGQSVQRWDCDELRRACLHKEELGEEGERNCERYRRHCGRD
jgi:hypothetical protein